MALFPTVEELVEKARASGFINSEVANDLEAEDFQDVLGAIYGYILEAGKDPDAVLQSWGIII